MEFAHVLQRCITHEYSGMINSCESGTVGWIDWADESWIGQQRTFLYCDCKNELTASGSFISDDQNGVKYKCTDCGKESLWDFDIAPVAIKIA